MTKQVLGKGLAALISENKEALQIADGEKIIELGINFISPNPLQPRKTFDQLKLNELASSIKEHGVIQPVVVCKRNDGKYILIAGERRYRAAVMLGLTKLPAIIKQVDSDTQHVIALIENIQREDLTHLEEAKAIENLIYRYNCSHEFVAKKLGKSRSYVSNILRLLNLPNDVKEALENNSITPAHAKIIANDPNASVHTKKFVQDNMTVREAEEYVKSLKDYKQHSGRYRLLNRGVDFDVNQLEADLTNAFGLKISIRDSKDGSAKVSIDFHSLEELDHIIQVLYSNNKSI